MGEKGFYDCPVRLYFYGPSDPTERARIEEQLKKDKLVKATELKNTRKDAEARRAIMGLTQGSSTAGVGEGDIIPIEPEVSLEELLHTSEKVEFRKGADAIQTMAFGEKELEKMPKADQPARLKAKLLPYQLQVCHLHAIFDVDSLILVGFEMDDYQREPQIPGEGFRRRDSALEARSER